MKRDLCIGAAFLTTLAALGVASYGLARRAVVEAAGVQAPRFEVDPMWPKPLPNHWIMGRPSASPWMPRIISGSSTAPASLEAGEQHATTNPPTAQCCAPAPPVLEFDEEGNLLRHWGGPGNGYDWPDSNHGITVDYKGNVWIGGNGRGPGSGAGRSMGRMKSLKPPGAVEAKRRSPSRASPTTWF